MNVASPPTVGIEVVPDSVPAPGFVPIAKAIGTPLTGTRVPAASTISTATLGASGWYGVPVMFAPGSASAGWVAKRSAQVWLTRVRRSLPVERKTKLVPEKFPCCLAAGVGQV